MLCFKYFLSTAIKVFAITAVIIPERKTIFYILSFIHDSFHQKSITIENFYFLVKVLSKSTFFNSSNFKKFQPLRPTTSGRFTPPDISHPDIAHPDDSELWMTSTQFVRLLDKQEAAERTPEKRAKKELFENSGNKIGNNHDDNFAAVNELNKEAIVFLRGNGANAPSFLDKEAKMPLQSLKKVKKFNFV